MKMLSHHPAGKPTKTDYPNTWHNLATTLIRDHISKPPPSKPSHCRPLMSRQSKLGDTNYFVATHNRSLQSSVFLEFRYISCIFLSKNRWNIYIIFGGVNFCGPYYVECEEWLPQNPADVRPGRQFNGQFVVQSYQGWADRDDFVYTSYVFDVFWSVSVSVWWTQIDLSVNLWGWGVWQRQVRVIDDTPRVVGWGCWYRVQLYPWLWGISRPCNRF